MSAIKHKDTQKFNSAFVSALSAWQLVEYELFLTYLHFFGKESHEAAAVAYNAASNLNVKREMTSALIRKSTLSEAGACEWEKLNQRIREKAKRRNDLAHRYPGFPKLRGRAMKIALGPPLTDPDFRAWKSSKSSDITESEISEWADAFKDLSHAIAAFRRKLP